MGNEEFLSDGAPPPVDNTQGNVARLAFVRAVMADDGAAVHRMLADDRSLSNLRVNGCLWRDAPDADDPNRFALSDQSVTVLHLAASNNRVSAAEALLDAGAEVNTRGYEGNLGQCTPLNLATFSGAHNLDVVRLLLSRGADPNARSSAGSSPLAAAAEHGEREICEALIDAGAVVGIQEAAAMDDMARVKALLDSAPELANITDSYRGYTALYFSRTDEMRELLLARGKRPGIVEASSLGMVARVLELLAEDPALVHARDKHNR